MVPDANVNMHIKLHGLLSSLDQAKHDDVVMGAHPCQPNMMSKNERHVEHILRKNTVSLKQMIETPIEMKSDKSKVPTPSEPVDLEEIEEQIE